MTLLIRTRDWLVTAGRQVGQFIEAMDADPLEDIHRPINRLEAGLATMTPHAGAPGTSPQEPTHRDRDI